ncbi:uncharacterized protein LOC142328907 isoform X2 [Lycorma delicatula]|uniref:uncharacterized protein LOC142328907 isoform X2 n=1 Tax=Lycorma delicatula TaxID=130591 RepID=UPI003F51A4D9
MMDMTNTVIPSTTIPRRAAAVNSLSTTNAVPRSSVRTSQAASITSTSVRRTEQPSLINTFEVTVATRVRRTRSLASNALRQSRVTSNKNIQSPRNNLQSIQEVIPSTAIPRRAAAVNSLLTTNAVPRSSVRTSQAASITSTSVRRTEQPSLINNFEVTSATKVLRSRTLSSKNPKKQESRENGNNTMQQASSSKANTADKRTSTTGLFISVDVPLQKECPVCFDFKDAVSTKCGHLFCYDCISICNTCPLCRQIIHLSDLHKIFY